VKRPRDSYKSRVYAAEFAVKNWGRTFRSEKANQDYVNKLCAEMEMAPIKVIWGKSKWYSEGCPLKRTVRVGGFSSHRKELVTHHEVAHVLQPPATAWHGDEFLMLYLRLVNWKIGSRAADQLIKELESRRVLK
jgi:hypothetical protein